MVGRPRSAGGEQVIAESQFAWRSRGRQTGPVWRSHGRQTIPVWKSPGSQTVRLEVARTLNEDQLGSHTDANSGSLEVVKTSNGSLGGRTDVRQYQFGGR